MRKNSPEEIKIFIVALIIMFIIKNVNPYRSGVYRPYKIYYKNGVLKDEGERKWEYVSTGYKSGYKKYRYRGERKIYYPDGTLHYEIISNPTLYEKKEYYHNGILKFEGKGYEIMYERRPDSVHYRNSKSYYSTGKLKSEFNEKEEHKKYINYHRNGTISLIGTSNTIKKEYDYEGNLSTDYKHYKENNLWHKEIVTYYPNGKIETIKRYIQTEVRQLFSDDYFYNENGESLSYTPDGKLFKKDIYDKGKLIKSINYGKSLKLNGFIKFYYDSKKLYSTENWKNNLREGIAKTYYETGELRSEGSFSKGLKTGVWKTYYRNGKIESQGKYFDGFPNGKWEWFHENGTIKESGQYIFDRVKRDPVVKYGIWEGYDENGKLEYRREHSW